MGVSERTQVIKEAFIESYRMLCTDNKDVLDEFLKRVEKSLNEDSVKEKLHSLQNSERKIVAKRKKLLDSYLEGTVSKEVYVNFAKKLH